MSYADTYGYWPSSYGSTSRNPYSYVSGAGAAYYGRGYGSGYGSYQPSSYGSYHPGLSIYGGQRRPSYSDPSSSSASGVKQPPFKVSTRQEQVEDETLWSFWVDHSDEYPGANIYTWKYEEWGYSERKKQWTNEWHHVHRIIEYPLEAQHAKWHAWDRARRPDFLPLADEDLGFYYDPSKVVYQQAMVTREGHPEGVSEFEWNWRRLNKIQYECQGCRIQQYRGAFRGEDSIIHGGRGFDKRDKNKKPKSLPSKVESGIWAPEYAQARPQGPYISLGRYGQWMTAKPVDTDEYNNLLRKRLIWHMQHRQINEEIMKAEKDPKHWIHATRPLMVVYQHPYLGPWLPRSFWFADPQYPSHAYVACWGFGYPLSCDVEKTDITRKRRCWLELELLRDANRRRLKKEGGRGIY